MCAKVDKTVLKEYFRSGKRPDESQFHDLIDSSYNAADNYSCHVSGYHVLAQAETRLIRRSAGKTFLVPVFNNLNASTSRTFHYSLPSCNLGPNHQLTSVNWAFQIAKMGENLQVPVTPGGEVREMKLSVKVHLSLFNGTTEFYSKSLKVEAGNNEFELAVEHPRQNSWEGISVDLLFEYEMVVLRPFPASFYESSGYSDLLQLAFGPFGLNFTVKS